MKQSIKPNRLTLQEKLFPISGTFTSPFPPQSAYSMSFMGLMNMKYAMVQLPRMMNTVATILCRASPDIPVRECPTVQPPAVAAPKPITMPPRKTLTSSFASLGVVSLYSFKPRALR